MTIKRDSPDTSSLRISRLMEDEGPRLRALRLRSLRDAPQAFGGSYEESATRPPEVWSQQLAQMPTFVAIADGHDVGIVRVALDEETAGTASLLSMWVAPEARGRGVGEALIEVVVEWAVAHDFASLTLDVTAENEPAINLYERMGFRSTRGAGAPSAPDGGGGERRMVRMLT